MEFERYEDVIDAFERDNMGYETLTDYIRGNNIKIAEIDMSPMGDLAKAFNKKDGGMMIAIEQLGKGGITGGKTYHQYHDQFVPPDSESEMYANGGGVGSMMKPKKKIPQLVKPNKDGSRPGYRGAGGYQGGGGGSSSSSSSGSSGNTGGGGGGGSTAREKGIMSRYQGPKGTTKSISNFRDTGPDRSAVGQFSQYGRNVMNQNLTRDNPSRRGGIGGFLSGIIPTILGFVNPFVGMAARGIMGIPKGIVNFNNKIQNSDFGKSTSLADYLDIRSYGGFDERELARQNTMQSAKDLQSRIDAGEFGGPNLQTNNSKPTANIQGTNLNDFEIGNPGKYATADMINEFGVKAGTADDSIANLSSLPGSADDRFANMYEDPFGNPTNDSRVVSEEMGLQGDGSIQNQNFMNQDYGIINSGKTIQEQFPVRSDFNVTKTLTPQGYEFVDNFQTNYMQETGKLPNSPFLGYNEALQDPINYTIDPSNLRVDASTNTNKQLLENIINKDMYDKNLQPFFDKQKKTNEAITNPDLLKTLGIIT